MLVEITGIQYPVNLSSDSTDDKYIKVKKFILNAFNNPRDYYIQIENKTTTKFIFLFSHVIDNKIQDPIHGWIIIDINDEIIDFHRESKNKIIVNHNNTSTDTFNESNEVHSTLQLSSTSFDVDGSSVNVSVPEMDIGSVEGTTFVINRERQNAQNEFMKKMGGKFAQR